MRSTLHHLPLEPYQSRYTEFLAAWEHHAFNKRFNVNRITPTNEWKSIQISTGEVLDSVCRPVWAMNQMMELLKQSPSIGHVWLSDFFHPGLEALPYSRSYYSASSFLWAQTFDKYDFTVPFISWMRPWEVMAFDIYDKVFVACDLLKELIVSAIPNAASKIEVVGLPFNHQNVVGRLKAIPAVRTFDCIYSSRFDVEKNPRFFLELVSKNPNYTFAICTGNTELRGTDSQAVRQANMLASQAGTNLTILTNCTKEVYYNALASSKVQFNCSSQDWVSFTLLEALTFGCLPLYPNARSFPETLIYEEQFMYIPGFMDSASAKLARLLEDPPNSGFFDDYRFQILGFHSTTLDRIAESLAQN